MKKLYGAMTAISIILVAGTFGALEQDTISYGWAVLQVMVSVGLGLVGAFGINLEERRGR